MKALVALAAAVVGMAFAGPALADRVITDTLAPGGGSSSQSQGYRFTTDTLAPGGSASVIVPSSGGFSWSDAGVGAGTAVGGMLALIGSTLIVTRRQSRPAV